MDKKKLESYRESLMKKQVELTKGFQRNKNVTNEDSGGGGSEDFVDYAVNAYTKEFLLSLSDLDRRALARVEEALSRIRKDEYGICTECEKPIGEKRLEAVPWTPCCISCQEKLELESSRATSTANSRWISE